MSGQRGRKVEMGEGTEEGGEREEEGMERERGEEEEGRRSCYCLTRQPDTS